MATEAMTTEAKIIKLDDSYGENAGAYGLRVDGDWFGFYDFFGPKSDDQAARSVSLPQMIKLYWEGWSIGDSRRLTGTIQAIRVA